MRQPSAIVVGLVLGAGLALNLSAPEGARAAETAKPAEAADAASAPAAGLRCRDTGRFSPPKIPWMGDFTYKVALTAKDGRPDSVSVEAVRAPDHGSNRKVVDALSEHIRQHYVCEGSDTATELYLSVHFQHEISEALRQRARTADERRQAAAALAASAVEARMAAGTLVPVRAGVVCTAMGKPELPRVNAVGELELEVQAVVTDGKVSAIDSKLLVGSKDAMLNQKFIDSVERALRDTYVCPGDHIFEQRFRFKLS